MDNLSKEEVSTPQLLAEAVNRQFQKMTGMIEGKATKEDWAKLVMENKEILKNMETVDENTANMKKELEKMSDAAKIQGETLSKLMNSFGTGKDRKTFKSVTYKTLTDNKKDLDNFVDEKVERFKMTIDTKDLAFGGTYGAGAGQHATMMFDTPLMPDVEDFDIRMLLPTGTIDQPKLSYPQERSDSRTDNSDWTTENAETTASEIGFTMATATAYYYKDHIKVSRFAMRDVSWLTSYIQATLLQAFITGLNNKVLTGDGTSNDIDGILNNANTFAGTGMESKFANADYFSVIRAARAELKKTYHRLMNTVMLDPIDYAIMADARTTIGGFLTPALGVANSGFNPIVGGNVVESEDITDGGYLVADIQPSTIQLLFNGPIDIMASEHDDDNFTKDLVTLKIGANVLLPIYKTTAFLKGTLSADKETINAGG